MKTLIKQQQIPGIAKVWAIPQAYVVTSTDSGLELNGSLDDVALAFESSIDSENLNILAVQTPAGVHYDVAISLFVSGLAADNFQTLNVFLNSKFVVMFRNYANDLMLVGCENHALKCSVQVSTSPPGFHLSFAGKTLKPPRPTTLPG